MERSLVNTRSTARTLNGIVSALIVVLFVIHALGEALLPFFSLPRPGRVLLWVGIALVGVHVLLSVVTSVEQLTDTQRPPSIQKKRHLALKWATGILLLAAAAIHIVSVESVGIGLLRTASGAAVIIALAVALAAHVWTGSKSLLKDLNISRKYRNAVRVVISCVAAVVVALVLAAAMV